MDEQKGGIVTHAEKVAIEVMATISSLVGALGMIEQGYMLRGSERIQLDAEGMRAIARLALEQAPEEDPPTSDEGPSS